MEISLPFLVTSCLIFLVLLFVVLIVLRQVKLKKERQKNRQIRRQEMLKSDEHKTSKTPQTNGLTTANQISGNKDQTILPNSGLTDRKSVV